MKIAVMGAGGVGGYFGAKLAAAGEDVHFIARGAHLQAIQSNGLQVYSANGDVLVKPARATSDPATVGPVELVMIAVKLWSTEEAVRDAKALIGPGTAVVSFQNGVVAVDAIAKACGKEHTLGGVANIAAVIEKPGVIRHTGTMAQLSVGELDKKPSARAQAFVDKGAPEAAEAVRLADVFCLSARRRVKALFRELWSNDDVARYELGVAVLEGHHRWMETNVMGVEEGRSRPSAAEVPVGA